MEKTKPLILQFLDYTAKPRLCESQKLPWYMIVFNIFRLWSLSFLLSMIFALLANFLLNQAGYSDEDFKLVELITGFSPLFIFLLVVFWASISEELGFRLWLRFSPVKWGLGLAFFVFFLTSLIRLPFIPEQYFTFSSGLGFLTSFLLIGSVFFLIFLLLKRENIGKIVETFFKRNFPFFFYTLAIFFAVIHITNYDVDLKTIWYFAPILIFPQLLLSFVISFIRMKYGFLWAVLTHSLNNAIAVTPLLFLAPILENESLFLEGVYIVEELSFYEMYLVVVIGFFLLMVFFLCFLSILSLLLEFTKREE